MNAPPHLQSIALVVVVVEEKEKEKENFIGFVGSRLPDLDECTGHPVVCSRLPVARNVVANVDNATRALICSKAVQCHQHPRTTRARSSSSLSINTPRTIRCLKRNNSTKRNMRNKCRKRRYRKRLLRNLLLGHPTRANLRT